MTEEVQSCRSEEGITVGAVDGVIAFVRLLARRDLSGKNVQEALADLFEDPDLRTILDAWDPASRPTETAHPMTDQPGPIAYARLAAEPFPAPAFDGERSRIAEWPWDMWCRICLIRPSSHRTEAEALDAGDRHVALQHAPAAEVHQLMTAGGMAEVTRLRTERDRLLAFANWTASNTRPLTEVHTAALTAIDSPSTRAALADLAQIAAEVAAGSDTATVPPWLVTHTGAPTEDDERQRCQTCGALGTEDGRMPEGHRPGSSCTTDDSPA